MPTIVNCNEVKGKIVSESGSKDLMFRDVFSKADGYTMTASYNDVLPGGNSKNHSHPEEHITFIVKGKGKLICGDNSYDISQGMAVYLSSNEPHCFRNTGDDLLVLFGILCWNKNSDNK